MPQDVPRMARHRQVGFFDFLVIFSGHHTLILMMSEHGKRSSEQCKAEVIDFPADRIHRSVLIDQDAPRGHEDAPLPRVRTFLERPMTDVELRTYEFFRRLQNAGLSPMLIGDVLFDRPHFLNGTSVHDALEDKKLSDVLFQNEFRYTTGIWAERSQAHQTKRDSSTA